ncbi:MAG: hypothetical protein E7256_16540 [Lachnospiraceae bacterium]|nr:hypothetical protein [Lachnospiraceae bacterium]
MYVWKNDKIRRQYDMEKFAAKNNGPSPFTGEELAITTLKAKAFQGIRDPKVKRMVELAYTLGTLNGLQTADQQLDVTDKARTAEKEAEQAKPAIMEERLYVMVCKVKNRQDKLVYTTLTLKARTDAEAETNAASECHLKGQTLIKCKAVKSFGTDSMQFQFGIGNKELTSLFEAGKKNLK